MAYWVCIIKYYSQYRWLWSIIYYVLVPWQNGWLSSSFVFVCRCVQAVVAAIFKETWVKVPSPKLWRKHRICWWFPTPRWVSGCWFHYLMIFDVFVGLPKIVMNPIHFHNLSYFWRFNTHFFSAGYIFETLVCLWGVFGGADAQDLPVTCEATHVCGHESRDVEHGAVFLWDSVGDSIYADLWVVGRNYTWQHWFSWSCLDHIFIDFIKSWMGQSTRNAETAHIFHF